MAGLVIWNIVLFISVHSSELWVGCEMHEFPKYLILISLNGLYPVFCLHFCFLIERERNPLWACWNTFYGSTDFFDQHWKCSQKRLIILMFFTCSTQGDKWFHIKKKLSSLIRSLNYSLKWNAMRKVCKFVQKRNVLEHLQIFPPGRPTSTSTSAPGEEVLHFLGRSV